MLAQLPIIPWWGVGSGAVVVLAALALLSRFHWVKLFLFVTAAHAGVVGLVASRYPANAGVKRPPDPPKVVVRQEVKTIYRAAPMSSGDVRIGSPSAADPDVGGPPPAASVAPVETPQPGVPVALKRRVNEVSVGTAPEVVVSGPPAHGPNAAEQVAPPTVASTAPPAGPTPTEGVGPRKRKAGPVSAGVASLAVVPAETPRTETASADPAVPPPPAAAVGTAPADAAAVPTAGPPRAARRAATAVALNTIFPAVDPSVGRVAFVVDISSSMFLQGRLVATLEDLIKVLKALPAGTEVSIIFFSDDAFPLGGKAATMGPVSEKMLADLERALGANRALLTQADEDTFARSVERGERQKQGEIVPGGGTKPHAAIRAALALKPEKLYLLTDGIIENEDLDLNRVEEWNTHKTVIRGIEIGNAPPTDFDKQRRLLYRLAVAHGGEGDQPYRYVQIVK